MSSAGLLLRLHVQLALPWHEEASGDLAQQAQVHRVHERQRQQVPVVANRPVDEAMATHAAYPSRWRRNDRHRLPFAGGPGSGHLTQGWPALPSPAIIARENPLTCNNAGRPVAPASWLPSWWRENEGDGPRNVATTTASIGAARRCTDLQRAVGVRRTKRIGSASSSSATASRDFTKSENER
jgi:hypothetical protein